LDYKGLANTGTWFIGRLQTDNDKARVLEALQSAGGASANEIDKMLSSLGKRVFLMHSVNLPKPMTFQTRWTMSYLAGPLTLEQIKLLMRDKKATSSAAKESAGTVTPKAAAPVNARPALPPTIKQFFLPTSSEGVTYYPMLLASANVRYSSVKQKIDTSAPQRFLVEITDNPVPVVWDEAQSIDFEVNHLETEPLEGAGFNDLASSANNAKNFDKWGKDFGKWLCSSQPLTLFSSPKFKAISNPGESENDFRARLTQIARETRDSSAEVIQKKYESKIIKLQDQLARAQAKQAEQAAQAQQAQLQAVVNVGIGVLGALFGGGGGRRTTSVARKVGSGLRGAGKAYKEGQDVSRAAGSVEDIQAELEALQDELNAELEAVSAVDPNEPLETVEIKAKSTDVNLELVALAWVPYAKDAQGRLVPAWA
jgi:hypothetical protein